MIELQDVTIALGGRPVLCGVDLACAQGEWLDVLGPTGGGKTTLLRVVAGLEEIAGGRVGIGGETATNHHIELAPHERGIGYVPQGPSLWPHLSVAANVELGIGDSVRSRRERMAEALGILAELGIENLAARFPGELSGGEARWAALARALAARPKILLLDEPTAHLDLHLRGQMIDRLAEFHQKLSLTTIRVTHELEPEIDRARRIIILEAGRVAFDGAIKRLDEAPPSEYVDALRRSITARGGTQS